MALKAVHYHHPNILKIELADEAGNPLAIYDARTDQVTPAPGVTVDTMFRAVLKEGIAEVLSAKVAADLSTTQSQEAAAQRESETQARIAAAVVDAEAKQQARAAAREQSAKEEADAAAAEEAAKQEAAAARQAQAIADKPSRATPPPIQ